MTILLTGGSLRRSHSSTPVNVSVNTDPQQSSLRSPVQIKDCFVHHLGGDCERRRHSARTRRLAAHGMRSIIETSILMGSRSELPARRKTADGISRSKPSGLAAKAGRRRYSKRVAPHTEARLLYPGPGPPRQVGAVQSLRFWRKRACPAPAGLIRSP